MNNLRFSPKALASQEMGVGIAWNTVCQDGMYDNLILFLQEYFGLQPFFMLATNLNCELLICHLIHNLKEQNWSKMACHGFTVKLGKQRNN